jgi:hypothetical protein
MRPFSLNTLTRLAVLGTLSRERERGFNKRAAGG